MEITILSGAEADLFDAWRRYEELLPGLGDRFDRAVREAFQQLRHHPESAPIYTANFRRLLLVRFEHGIYYRIHGQRIAVAAVLSLRQDPDFIKARLEG